MKSTTIDFTTLTIGNRLDAGHDGATWRLDGHSSGISMALTITDDPRPRFALVSQLLPRILWRAATGPILSPILGDDLVIVPISRQGRLESQETAAAALAEIGEWMKPASPVVQRGTVEKMKELLQVIADGTGPFTVISTHEEAPADALYDASRPIHGGDYVARDVVKWHGLRGEMPDMDSCYKSKKPIFIDFTPTGVPTGHQRLQAAEAAAAFYEKAAKDLGIKPKMAALRVRRIVDMPAN